MKEKDALKKSMEFSLGLINEVQALSEKGSPLVSILASDLLKEAQAMHQRLCLINNAIEKEYGFSAKRKHEDDYGLK
jgi:hypothetical protein